MEEILLITWILVFIACGFFAGAFLGMKVAFDKVKDLSVDLIREYEEKIDEKSQIYDLRMIAKNFIWELEDKIFSISLTRRHKK